jgi:hypothetical protein
MRGGLVPRNQEHGHHRYHLVTTEPRAFLFDADEFGNQALATDFAGVFQLLL